jgi:hypothetical protein
MIPRWIESDGTCAKGHYYISAPAIESLRRAFSMAAETEAS